MVARSMGNAHAVRVAKRRHCQMISKTTAEKEILRCTQNDKTTFCYRRVLQQQVKRSIAVGYAVWVAKSKTSQ